MGGMDARGVGGVIWVGVFAAVALAAAAQALSGFGFALIAVPLVAVLVGPKEAVVGIALVGAFLVVWMTFRLAGTIDRRAVVVILAFGVVGMPLGLLILERADERLLTAIIAAVVIVFTVLLWRGLRFPAGRATDAIAGFTAGILSTSTGTSGPPFVIALTNRGVEPDEFRRTLAVLFLVQSVLSLALFTVSGQVTRDAVQVALAGVPGLVLGWMVGEWAFSRLSAEAFRRIVLGMLLLSGLVSLAGAELS